MSEQSINEIPAGQLERGQHVIRPRNGVPTVYRIENTFDYTRDGAPMVALLLSPIGGGVPIDDRKWASAKVPLASEDQVADAVDAARGDTVVRGLRAFADLMADLRPKVRAYGGPSVSVQLLDGEVSRLSEVLSLPLREYGQTSKSVTWQSETSDFSDGVSVTFYGKPAEPEPEPAAEQAGAGA